MEAQCSTQEHYLRIQGGSFQNCSAVVLGIVLWLLRVGCFGRWPSFTSWRRRRCDTWSLVTTGSILFLTLFLPFSENIVKPSSRHSLPRSPTSFNTGLVWSTQWRASNSICICRRGGRRRFQRARYECRIGRRKVCAGCVERVAGRMRPQQRRRWTTFFIRKPSGLEKGIARCLWRLIQRCR